MNLDLSKQKTFKTYLTETILLRIDMEMCWVRRVVTAPCDRIQL
jgi:hypothetical protein